VIRKMALMVAVGAAFAVIACAADIPDEVRALGQFRTAIAPSPIGEGHLGRLESGDTVQLRFPVPKQRPLAFWVNVGNVVGFTGKGASYQLVLRRDAADGPVIHEGPMVPVGDDWNASNREPIEITEHLTDQHLAQGFIDLFVSGIVEGDGWTVYRHNPGRREITATFVPGTPEIRRSLEAARQVRERGITIIPMPARIEVREGTMLLSGDSRIALGPLTGERDRLAAEDLAEQIRERTGLRLSIVTRDPRPGDILLERVQTFAPEPEGAYHLSVSESARVTASSDAGLFYGAQTIAQLVEPDGAIPRVEIADEPAYQVRALQYDVARGQTVEVEWWKRLIRGLARCKLNMLVIYGENDYAFDAFPFLGREGTFTPQKARELSEFAHRYHVQLVPQFESLGHASAVLRHEQLADLREAGQPWVFCTSNPATWEFLDTVYGELAAQFPHAQYIHVGGDEFEGGFARCELCRARAEADGVEALYAEHMNRLNDLCRKHGRTMLFWPSHEGLTTGSAAMLRKDCIPTEWIYHGPATYPQIEQYQDLGFQDVWASPAVVCFSRIWPDYPTTWRGIRGFLQAGQQREIGGCMTTTWEWQHGAIVTNSLPGMFFAAECAWSPTSPSVAEFERAFADFWFGLSTDDAGERLHSALIEPWPRETAASICYAGRMITDAWWAPPRTALRDFAVKDSRVAEAAPEVIRTSDAALERLREFRADVSRNADLLAHTELAIRMCREAGHKLVALQDAADAYEAALRAFPEHPATAAARIRRAAHSVRTLTEPLAQIAAMYEDAARSVGAAMRDVRRVRALHEATTALADDLDALATQVRAHRRESLPSGVEFGFIYGTYAQIGSWSPAEMSEDGVTLRFDVSEHVSGPGELIVEWEYTDGSHGLEIRRTSLLRNGRAISTDEHAGWTGSGTQANTYRLEVTQYDPEATWEIEGEVSSRGGTDSRGEVWLIVP